MDFSKMTIGQLKRELALRNARVSGRKSDLVQRLVANLYSSFCKVIRATTLTPTGTGHRHSHRAGHHYYGTNVSYDVNVILVHSADYSRYRLVRLSRRDKRRKLL